MKKERCPLCGKFISNDVAEKIALKKEVDGLKEELLKKAEALGHKSFECDKSKESLLSKIHTLEASNNLMDEELKRLKGVLGNLRVSHKAVCEELKAYKAKSLFERIFRW